MVKAILITPIYLSIAWVLMISYQIFTETAVTTVVDAVYPLLPSLSLWVMARIDLVVFVYSFAWVFVLSSIIPSLLLGRERSVMIQFVVCLTLALTGIILIGVLNDVYHINLTDTEVLFSNPYTQVFTNAFFAIFYLMLPYLFMVALDFRGRKRKQRMEAIKEVTDEFYSEQPTDLSAV